ncbi:MAG TPA: L,D-transpeptidase family protein [Phycisphaerae bacterium]|nr:L,D-transpeptidase family protein [Phycisphaerae bacterium]HUT59521.1 L,D-transpeptidase family protein [Phycisphaerae bacterium]
MKRSTRRALGVFVAGAATIVVIILVISLAFRPKDGTGTGKPSDGDGNTSTPGRGQIIEEPNRPPTTFPTTAATGPASALSRAEAVAAYNHGRALLKQAETTSRATLANRLHLEARSELSRSFFSGQLTGAEQAQAIKDLSGLFKATVLARQVIEGDPYALPYVVQPGETVEGKNGIEQKFKLHVPARLILRVNGLTRGEDLRPGRTIKLVKGPFHAIVDKSDFTMDMYLHREGLEPIFVKRVNVGLGMNSSTPVGSWRVALGQKMERPPWDPPPGSGLKRRILWGEPGYAFGIKGLWIGLEGTDAQTGAVMDFGIHSTNDPNSIGRANSLGCVRMADDDIDLVFALLYDVHSTVIVRP